MAVREHDSRQSAQLALTRQLPPIIALATDAVSSPHTRRAYARALSDFLAWVEQTRPAGLTKATVQAYVTHLKAEGAPASSLNQRLTAIRKLAFEAADNGLIDPAAAEAIARVQGVRREGRRLGNWLTREQAQELLRTPDATTLKGLRDRALLAVLLGCGLRRQEAAGLTMRHLQQREGRWVIVDLVGKRNKTRSTPMPAWAKAAMDEWTEAAGIEEGPVFRPLRRGGHVQPGGMSAQAVFDVVRTAAAAAGLAVRPHDLRRTFAKLAHKGGASIDQIQLSLGHSSVQTTERYLGVDQDLTTAPCDVLGLRL
jgi:site-specific recombinase XerD